MAEDYKEPAVASAKDENPYKDELDLLKKMDDYFKYALDHPTWVGARADMEQCNRYVEGEQWTEEEKSILKDRKQPATVNNMCSVTVNKLVGDLVDQKVRIGFRGRNQEPDAASAQDLSDIFLHIRQSNDLEFEERDMAKDGFVGGFGVIEAYPTFDDLYQPEIKVQMEDALAVFPDPDSKRYDWNEDAKYLCRAKWLDADEAEQKYPKIKGVTQALLTDSSLETIAGGQLASVEQFRGDNYVDKKRKRIRLIEVQYKKYIRECIYLCADGTIYKNDEWTPEVAKSVKAAGMAYEKLDRVKPKICIGLYGASTVIDHKVTDRKYFSLVPYWVYRKKNGAPYSLITLALSIQDAINKRESKALHLLNSNQVVAERSAISDKDKFAEELALPDGIAIAEDGALANNKLELRNNLELAQGQQNMHTSAVQAFYAVTGINPNTYSNTGEIRSGSGLKTKFAEASKPIAAIFDNLKRTRKILGRVLLDLVQIYYTGEKILLITDDPKAQQRQVTIDADKMQRIKQMNYDVVVDDFEDVSNVQQEQWALWMQYLPQLMQAGPFWQKKLLAASDIRDKDQIMKELDAQGQPPPLQPRISFQANLDTLTPPERAYAWHLMGSDELAQRVQQDNIPTSHETSATVELAKAKIQANSKTESQ